MVVVVVVVAGRVLAVLRGCALGAGTGRSFTKRGFSGFNSPELTAGRSFVLALLAVELDLLVLATLAVSLLLAVLAVLAVLAAVLPASVVAAAFVFAPVVVALAPILPIPGCF